MTGQKRIHSLFEQVLSTTVAFGIAILAAPLIFALIGIQSTFSQDLKAVVLFTLLSILRGYVVRRTFNYLHTQGILK